MWTKVVSEKYLSKVDFFEVKKSTTPSRIWKYVLDHRYLLMGEVLDGALGIERKSGLGMITGWTLLLS